MVVLRVAADPAVARVVAPAVALAAGPVVDRVADRVARLAVLQVAAAACLRPRYRAAVAPEGRADRQAAPAVRAVQVVMSAVSQVAAKTHWVSRHHRVPVVAAAVTAMRQAMPATPGVKAETASPATGKTRQRHLMPASAVITVRCPAASAAWVRTVNV